jgi:ribonuclease P protein component
MKIQHVLKSKDFAEIFEKGRKTREKKISLHVKKCDNEKGFSVGIVISKRFAAQAVTRNYVRRLIYAYFRDHGDYLRGGFKVVVRVIGDLREFKKRALSTEIRETLGMLIERTEIKK